METLRKAIDKLPVLLKAHIYEPSIDAVAEISFKAGYDQAMEAKELQHKIRMARLSLGDDYGDKDMEDEAIFKAGMQKVVDWIGEHGRMTYAKATGEVTFDHINYTNFLKEKGLK